MLKIVTKPEPTEPVTHSELCSAMDGLICRIDSATAMAAVMHSESSNADEETLARARYGLEYFLEDTMHEAAKIRAMLHTQGKVD